LQKRDFNALLFPFRLVQKLFLKPLRKKKARFSFKRSFFASLILFRIFSKFIKLFLQTTGVLFWSKKPLNLVGNGKNTKTGFRPSHRRKFNPVNNQKKKLSSPSDPPFFEFLKTPGGFFKKTFFLSFFKKALLKT